MIRNVLNSLVLIIVLACNTKDKSISQNENINKNSHKEISMNNNQTIFKLVSEKFVFGTTQFKVREMKSYYDVSEFLSKLWFHFGKPNSIIFEGYMYAIKDTESDVIFTAYCAGSGPAYGGKTEDFDKLEKIISDFELLLSTTPIADCEIEVENDFGTFKYGAKNGKTYIEQ